MGEIISKEHVRRAMGMLENLTGGMIKKEDILREYKRLRKKKYTRMDALWESFSHFAYNVPLSIHNTDSVKVSDPIYEEEIYKDLAISYPNAKPVKYVLAIYWRKNPSYEDFSYSIYEDGKENSKSYSWVSYETEEDAVREGLKDFVQNLLEYAVMGTAKMKNSDVLFKV